MIDFFLVMLVNLVIALRYRVRIIGLDKILRKGREGILFLPNHPALIDPIILLARLYRPFRARALADETQINRFFIRWLARRIRVLPIPDLTIPHKQSARQIRSVIDRCIAALRNGDNLVLYPAGRIYRQNSEIIGANSAVEHILKAIPEVRVVLVRTRGLWGSRFSWAYGRQPLVMPALLKGLKSLLLNAIFFMPKRTVEIEFTEPDDFPRTGGRKVINAYLEKFYNQIPERNTYIPYTVWEKAGVQIRPEPPKPTVIDDSHKVSPIIRQQVERFLAELSGTSDFTDDSSLARELGLDSLAVVETIAWLESEYGYTQIEVDSLRTVGDVLLAACGQAVSIGEHNLQKVPGKWFQRPPQPQRPDQMRQMDITRAFLEQARKNPDKAIIADQVSGVKTYRDMVLAIMLLRRRFAGLDGDYIGIMLPASAAAGIVYLAVLFAGKIPVMVNWTLGRRHLRHTLDSLEVRHIITSERLLSRIQAQGVVLDDIRQRLLCLETLRTFISRREKLIAWCQSRISWSSLQAVTIPETAVVLFTSGSENVPKAVPLTHHNILTNIADAYECFTITEQDAMLGILPPFHSFGLTVSLILPLTLGLRVVYYPNPTHGGALGRIIDAYNLSILVGTPVFLNGIIRASSSEQLLSLRLVVSGAEKCPSRVYRLLEQYCPQTTVIEGYGVTECSPIISVNHEDDPHPGTIGKVMSSLEYVIVHPETGQRLEPGQDGVLLVRGDSVFGGYLNYTGESPFVEIEGKAWYRTGDLVIEDEQGILTFGGRLQRFIKLGGEMISLPAIEDVLQQEFSREDDEGPILAVSATADEENPEIILFCIPNIPREAANKAIRAAGLSGLHNIRRVVQVENLPLLGTGKVNYRALTES